MPRCGPWIPTLEVDDMGNVEVGSHENGVAIRRPIESWWQAESGSGRSFSSVGCLRCCYENPIWNGRTTAVHGTSAVEGTSDIGNS